MKYQSYQVELNNLKSISQFRTLNPVQKREGAYIFLGENKYLNFSSNDYLGLTVRQEFYREFQQYLNEEDFFKKYPLSSSSSRLLTGNPDVYEELEKELSLLYDRESALVFNSGYHANIGIISALAKKGDVIFCDKLNHASMIDGLKLADADFFRYKHNDLEALEKLLIKKRASYNRAWIVSESIFSMDGDSADLKNLLKLKNKYDCYLYIDEAHSCGVFGEKGLGLCEQEGILKEVDILMGTFGKALGGLGAYAVMDEVLRDFLINQMRPFIFTTALSPFQLLWNLFVLKKIPFLQKERDELLKISQKLKKGFIKKGYEVPSDSQIVPLIIGENEKTVLLAEQLKENQILASAIRPPTVPKNTSRLRFSLTAALDEKHIKKVLELVPERV